MVARVTLAEIDTMRMALDDAVRRFEGSVLPRLREVGKFVTLFRAAPGREHYDVVVADVPMHTGG